MMMGMVNFKPHPNTIYMADWSNRTIDHIAGPYLAWFLLPPEVLAAAIYIRIYMY